MADDFSNFIKLIGPPRSIFRVKEWCVANGLISTNFAYKNGATLLGRISELVENPNVAPIRDKNDLTHIAKFSGHFYFVLESNLRGLAHDFPIINLRGCAIAAWFEFEY